MKNKMDAKGGFKLVLIISFFVFAFFTTVVDAETLEMISNTDICIYDPLTNTDYCKTEYELCDNQFNISKVNFTFADFTKEETEWKGSIEGLDTEIKIEDEGGDCWKIEIEGTKNPLLDIDNVLCYDGNCHYEYALWNGSFNLRIAIFGNVTSLSASTTGLIPLNLTINGSLETFWCNFTVNQTNTTIGYVYFNNQSDYICVDTNETSAVRTLIDEGNGTSFNIFNSLMSHLTMNDSGTLYDISGYNKHCTSVTGDPVTGTGKIGRSSDIDTDDWFGCGDPLYDTYTDELSFMYWIKIKSDVTGHILGKSGGSGADRVFLFYYDATPNNLKTEVYNIDDSEANAADMVSALDLNTWYHIGYRINSTHTCIYVNSSLESCVSGRSGNLNQVSMQFSVGANNNGASGSPLFEIDNFMMFNNTITEDDIILNYFSSREFFDNGSVEMNGSIIDITFISQIPADITTTNIMNGTLNITYNIVGISLNTSTIRLETIVNNTGTAYFHINGISTLLDQAFNYSSQIINTFLTLLSDVNLYPGSYNIDDEIMIDTQHSPFIASNDNNLIKIRFLNISNDTENMFLQIMVNSTSPNACDIFYCNSSYSTGSVISSTDCGGFASIQPDTSFTHNKSSFSQHISLAAGLNITTGDIAGVGVTPLSYMIIRGVGCNTWYISNNTGTVETSNNNGLAWASQSWTVDAHIHNYHTNETLYYRQCANTTDGEMVCSPLRSDTLEITPLPPSAPVIITPQEETISGNINISYQACVSPLGNAITFYNISLLFPNLTFNTSISDNNSLNLSYDWNTTVHVDGDYIIRVYCEDNQSLSTTAISHLVTILNNPIAIIPTTASFCSDSNTLYSRVVSINTINGNETIEIDESFLLCSNGCDNISVTNLGSPGCIGSDFLQTLIWWPAIMIVFFLLFYIPSRITRTGKKKVFR